jgi:CelD/BcsL family acetyltransferase involved in cellulose biosynthesis
LSKQEQIHLGCATAIHLYSVKFSSKERNVKNKIEIDIVNSDDEFETLQHDWVRLSGEMTGPGVFNSWSWQSCWWNHYGCRYDRSRQLHIMVARLRRSGEIVGLLPAYTCKQRILKLFSIPTLNLIGTGGDTSPDYLNPLIDPEHEVAVCNAFAESLAKRPWSVLSLHDIGTNITFRDALLQQLAESRIHHQSGQSAEIAWIALPDEWDGYLSTLSKNRRYQIRQQRRKFEAAGNTRFYVWQDRDNLDHAIDALIELHLKRWEPRDTNHAFSTENYVNFHRELMHQLFAQDQLRLYCLELEGELVAMLYCYRWKEHIYFFQGGFDPGYEGLRVGNVIMGYAIEHAINEGNQVFDMLKGDYRYKRSLAKENNHTWHITAVRFSIPGLIYRFRHEFLPSIKKFICRI